MEIVIENKRWDPFTGTASAVVGTYYGMFSSIAGIVSRPIEVHRAAVAAKGTSQAASDAVSTTSTYDSSSQTLSFGDSSPTTVGSLRTASSTSNLTPRTTGSMSLNGSTRSKKASEDFKLVSSMTMASASGVGDFFKHYSKGVLLDMPLAFAEGSRAIPKLYGEKVRDYGQITDWKSGLKVSGKSLLGIGEGFADLAVKPVQGVIEDGVVGGVLGVAKGFMGFSTKVSSGKHPTLN